EAERGLLPGLVDGDVSRLPASVKDDFRSVGLTHLTAVSGTNVAVVVGAVLLLLAPDLAPSAGFALSVLATAGLVVLAPGWRDRWATRLPGWLADALA